MLTEKNLYYTLRVASAMCFIGHGAFGIITKEIWCNYFAVFGISHNTAFQLMPVLGAVDILMGLVILFYPVRILFLWLVLWGAVTAALRPLSGEPFAELLERAGNFGAPLAFLLMCGAGKNFSAWFRKVDYPNRATSLKAVRVCLQVVVFLLLIGHGWLNLMDKKGLLSQYNSMGFHDVHQVALIMGLMEIGMAFAILIRPLRPLVLIFLVWKIGIELFYPHYELFEWLERGASYGSLLALYLVIQPEASIRRRLQWAPGFIATALALVFTLYFGREFIDSENGGMQDSPVAEQSHVDAAAFTAVMALDRQTRGATFVFVNAGFVPEIKHNKVILLKPIGDDLRINFDEYVHPGHNGPLYIILPERYAGPKEKFILKSFPDYHVWYGSMLTSNYVMYAAK